MSMSITMKHTELDHFPGAAYSGMDDLAILSVESLSKSFEVRSSVTKVIDNVSFQVRNGEFLAIVGPSGCGKSTFFNILSGLLEATSGTIRLSGMEITGPTLGIGYMQQKDLLLPWLTIEDNVTLGLRLTGRKFDVRDTRERLAKFGLGAFSSSYPRQLSGGMRQRVALLRALATEPKILLLDEPFSALDFQTRLILEKELLDTTRALGMTTLLVTHDIGEAISLADRVIVLGPRPTTNIANIAIDFHSTQRPDVVAARETPEYASYFHQIWELLSQCTN